LTYIRQSYCKK